MGARGRKSAGELTAAPLASVLERPSAPLDLTPEQSEVWASVVDAMPADWFSAENLPLLAQYCRHVVEARRIAQLIDQECDKSDLDVTLYGELLRMQRLETSALKAMAASMRLAQQSRYTDKAAGTAQRRGAAVARPWR